MSGGDVVPPMLRGDIPLPCRLGFIDCIRSSTVRASVDWYVDCYSLMRPLLGTYSERPTAEVRSTACDISPHHPLSRIALLIECHGFLEREGFRV